MSVQEMGGSITSMRWSPALIKLTQVGIASMAPSVAFVNPEGIYQIYRTRVWYNDDKSGDPIQCTEVFGAYIKVHVLETPEEVCRLRDESLGHSHSTTSMKVVK